MSFPLQSKDPISPACKRFAEVVYQRSYPSRRRWIIVGEIFACKDQRPFPGWSEHAWGNAIDLMANPVHLRQIANNVLLQAKKKTFANKGVLVPVHTIIYQRTAWDTERPYWHPYTGIAHTNHVHVDFLPGHNDADVPPCAK